MNTGKVVGFTLLGGAIGGLVYLGYRWWSGRSSGGVYGQVAVQDLGNDMVQATVSWTGGQAVVQGNIVGGAAGDENVIDGHFWVSQAIAQQAENLYNSGERQQAAAMVLLPANRLATGNDQAILYAAKPVGGAGAVFEFWIRKGTNTSKLIWSDPVGIHVNPLPGGVPKEGVSTTYEG